MPEFKVLRLRGNKYDKQEAANKAGADLYYEQHFNSAPEPGGSKATYSAIVTSTNASDESLKWASDLVNRWVKRFGTKLHDWSQGNARVPAGILFGGYRGRGNSNLKNTNMPAILGEPMFVSNPRQADFILTPAGKLAIAEELVASIRMMLPDGGIVALSEGHIHNPGRPRDRGAGVKGHPYTSEGEQAEMVLDLVEDLLTGTGKAEEDEDGGHPEWSKDGVGFVTENGIMSNFKDGSFRGNNPLTRYELAVILERYHKKFGG